MRVVMLPHLRYFRSEESGIKRVVEAYHDHLPAQGIELVSDGMEHDVRAVHAGIEPGADVAHCHGLYWTADYPAVAWEWRVNRDVVESLRTAKRITVPSNWVAETIRRDMRRSPHVIGHGIDWDDWQHEWSDNGYVLWNKNRASDVCDPRPVAALARAHRRVRFVTTFAPASRPDNVQEIGVIAHEDMKQLVQASSVYLATVKETFGIGILEAMASGVPVLGYAHGGILDLVEHGVNGYLAPPGDLEALAEGLAYCVQHRKVLGENGREMARERTWERVAEQVADVYRAAAEARPATVAVVIPTYNYAGKVGRAIESALNQTRSCDVVVVDDGSTDGTEAAVARYPVQYVKQQNQGVAAARNNGIAATDAQYVCCLDADDAIEPRFLEVCVNALEADPSLGIAYTTLRYVLPSGEEGVSPWPGRWDFDGQLRRQNQVPTCCVFRRDMWEALGGYRSRYCPQGAGSEDAEFWTRSGAYGWKAAKVTEEPLFVYSWQSGRVSGQENYREPDWLAWHPWARDGQHPFASYATPKRFSHPVRAYDEPAVSIVIPIGPGHQDVLVDALDSVEAQTFRKWEAIVAWDQPGPVPERLSRAYPFVRWVEAGGKGAGHARNAGVEEARAPLLLFLDADDWLYPEALEKMYAAWEQEGACVYTDYVGEAFIEDPAQLAPDLQRRILQRDDDGRTVMRYDAADYDWRRAQRQPEDRPWIWCNITTLVPRAWHVGFDEGMESWEDVDYWYRIARAGKPFVRIAEPLLYYRFYTGGRRDHGAGMHAELVGYLRQKYEEIPNVGCTKCGSKARSSAARRVTPTARRQIPMTSRLPDDDFILCRYASPNRGQHAVIGGATFAAKLPDLNMVRDRNTGHWKIHYGFRGGGDEFLVHRSDADLQPHLFVTLEQRRPPEVERATPTPVPLDGPPVRIEVRGNGRLDLQKIPGVTAPIAKALEERGFTTAEKIVEAGFDGLTALDGVGKVRAASIMEQAEKWAR